MSKQKLLIADDAQFMRAMIRDIAESNDFEVVGEATNGQEAIEMFKKLRPDIVTMDLVMPLASGLEGLAGIRKIDDKAKVIVISAIDQRDSLMQAIKLGAIDFIVKPFDDDRVSQALKAATRVK